MRCQVIGAGRADGQWSAEYITAYIIHTMRSAARISYFEISARYGLCRERTFIVAAKERFRQGGQPASPIFQVPVTSPSPGPTLHVLGSMITSQVYAEDVAGA